QSFRDSELRFLGRLHDRAQAIRAYHNLREAGFDNVSLDLIYGLPGQTARELALSLEQLVELEPRHVSTYCLSLADQVPLSAYKNRIPSDRVLALFYRKIRMQLTGSGYRQYEISNFCSPGFHSRHNKAYWDGRYYLGLGPAAAGYLPGIRYHHPESLRIYEKMIRSGDILSQREILNSSILEKEYIMLKLRTSEGMMLADYKRKFGFDFEIRFHHLLKKYDRSILPCQGGKLKISADYYFVSDEIIADFIAVIDSLE
ncbi:MAG: hypothetical protein JXB60_06670, partial [Candidatus Cloacimonetes bacterium]|nr:hypothetical protein [Candidatus Cloacimonadota bacterium]